MHLWHKRINVISGTMALSYRHGGPEPAVVAEWIKELKTVMSEMEGFI
jgi:hypothetical protein